MLTVSCEKVTFLMICAESKKCFSRHTDVAVYSGEDPSIVTGICFRLVDGTGEKGMGRGLGLYEGLEEPPARKPSVL